MSLDELVPPAATSTAGGHRHGDPGGDRPEGAPDLLRRPAQERHPRSVGHHLIERGAEVQRSGHARLHGHHQQDDLAARGERVRRKEGRWRGVEGGVSSAVLVEQRQTAPQTTIALVH